MDETDTSESDGYCLLCRQWGTEGGAPYCTECDPNYRAPWEAD